jgi:glutamate synthase (NADPH/NADH) small chain
MATQKMLKFVTVGKEMPEKRDAASRAQDFHEIYREYADRKAAEQASRCSQCGVPYCQSHCPLHNNIPDWLKLTAEGRLQEAYEISQATNTFPEICGRICPQDRLCEGNCVIEFSGHGAVTIGSVEKYITDTAWEEGWVEPLDPAPDSGQSIGIIGAGPAGLTAAEYLRAAGHTGTTAPAACSPMVFRVSSWKSLWSCGGSIGSRRAASSSIWALRSGAMRRWNNCANGMMLC